MKLSKANIESEIKKLTGLNVKLQRGEGYHYFYSDDNDTALILNEFKSASVYVMYLKDLPLDRWVGEFLLMLETYKNKY